jgi:hypothetical protein
MMRLLFPLACITNVWVSHLDLAGGKSIQLKFITRYHEVGALDVVLTPAVSTTADEFSGASGYLFMAERTDLAVATKI